MVAKTDAEKIAAYDRMIEGSRRGGAAEKHFTPESWQRRVDGCRKGGKTPKHFSSDSKQRQINGSKLGGQHSHWHDNKPTVEKENLPKVYRRKMSPEVIEQRRETARKMGLANKGREYKYTTESKLNQINGGRLGGKHSHGGHSTTIVDNQ